MEELMKLLKLEACH